MYFVYIIRSLSSKRFYTGYTLDVKKRVMGHNAGRNVSTSGFDDWELVTYIAFSEKSKAVAFERYLKSGSGIAFANKHLR